MQDINEWHSYCSGEKSLFCNRISCAFDLRDPCCLWPLSLFFVLVHFFTISRLYKVADTFHFSYHNQLNFNCLLFKKNVVWFTSLKLRKPNLSSLPNEHSWNHGVPLSHIDNGKSGEWIGCTCLAPLFPTTRCILRVLFFFLTSSLKRWSFIRQTITTAAATSFVSNELNCLHVSFSSAQSYYILSI